MLLLLGWIERGDILDVLLVDLFLGMDVFGGSLVVGDVLRDCVGCAVFLVEAL